MACVPVLSVTQSFLHVWLSKNLNGMCKDIFKTELRTLVHYNIVLVCVFL